MGKRFPPLALAPGIPYSLRYSRLDPSGRPPQLLPSSSPALAKPALLAYDYQTTAVHTPVFDGPLELLLYLVRREGVDIREVDICPITDAFLAQINLMEALDLDVASEFLVLAATLCHLKSRELMPRLRAADDGDDEAREIREALHRRLVEYERYREASEELGARPMLDRDTFTPQPEPVRGVERPVVPGVDALGLLEIFYQVLRRKATAAPVHEVERDARSIRDMADWVLAELESGSGELADLLFALDKVGDRIMAFLAVLELARLRLIELAQGEHAGPVELARRPDADLGALASLSVASGA